jgi:hypothetical protein
MEEQLEAREITQLNLVYNVFLVIISILLNESIGLVVWVNRLIHFSYHVAKLVERLIHIFFPCIYFCPMIVTDKETKLAFITKLQFDSFWKWRQLNSFILGWSFSIQFWLYIPCRIQHCNLIYNRMIDYECYFSKNSRIFVFMIL